MSSRFANFLLSACLTTLGSAQSLPTYTMSSAIGTGTAGFAGDSAAASAAQLNYPMAMAIAPDGTIYIADSFNYRIRSVKADGVIRTVVGTGTSGFTGDGASATAALISSIYGVAVDKDGNLYFSDTQNNTIRKVGSNGIVSLIAGTGAAGFSGDGAAATAATMFGPTGIVVDNSGNVYFSDTSNHRIRKIGTDGNISTIAGDGQAIFGGDGGPATSASLHYPAGLAVDSTGVLYIADSFNHRIRKILPDGTIVTVAGTNSNGYSGDGGLATQATLNYPKSVYIDAAGKVYIADTYNSRIRVVTEDGKIHLIAGSGFYGDNPGDFPALAASMRFPRAVLPDGQGGFYVLDTDNSRIRRLVPNPAAPTINSGGVLSLSEFGGFSKAAPGSWLEIYGVNLAKTTREWTAADFVNGIAPTSLAGTTVTIGGTPAYLSYVSPGQVNVQIPDTVPVGAQNIVISTALGSTAPYKFTFDATQPGLFAPVSLAASGRQYAGVVHADGSLVSSTRALQPGETVTLYGIGFGSVAPRLTAGEVVHAANSVVEPLKVYVSGAEATVTYAGLAPGTLGLYQINIVVPQVGTSDAASLTFQLNGQNGVQNLYTIVGK